jgi:hypothetical protein
MRTLARPAGRQCWGKVGCAQGNAPSSGWSVDVLTIRRGVVHVDRQLLEVNCRPTVANAVIDQHRAGHIAAGVKASVPSALMLTVPWQD